MADRTGKQLKEIYDKFSDSTKPVHLAYIKSIHALVNLAEAKDPYTKKHSVKVANYAVLLAKRLGLSAKDVATVKLAGILHDIGKIAIREEVLLKEGSLSGKEYEEVKKHSEIGAEIIKPLKFFRQIITIIKYHHENYDGTGYPDGLKGDKIPLISRILAIADTYDALTSKRAYRGAYSSGKALAVMKEESGRRLDPELLKIFMDCLSSKGNSG